MELPWPKELMQSKAKSVLLHPLWLHTNTHFLLTATTKTQKAFLQRPSLWFSWTLSLVSMLTFHSAGLQPRDHHTCGAVCAFKATGFHFYFPFFFFFLGDFRTNQCEKYPSIFWDWLGGRSQTPLYFAHWLRPTNQPKHTIKKICLFFFC